MEATLIIFPRINQVQSHCYITTLTTWSAVGRLEETFIEPILKYHINQKAELERVPKEENNNIPHKIYLKNIVYDTYLPITIFSIQCELVSRLKTKKARPPPYLLPHNGRKQIIKLEIKCRHKDFNCVATAINSVAMSLGM